jgi:hypothetical protein
VRVSHAHDTNGEHYFSLPSIASAEFDADRLTGFDVCPRRRVLARGAAVAVRFEFESELGADALRLTHAAAAYVRHQ